ncbi:MAG: FxLYD domain-containing protein [Leptolyngbya sp. BL-A-14]
MKISRWAFIPLTVATLFLPTVRAVSVSPEPDYPCYMRTVSGRVLNLTALCVGKPVAVDVDKSPISQEAIPQSQKKAVNSGQVVETAREIKDNGSGSWTLSGKIQNQTQQMVRGLSVTLRVQAGAQTLTPYTRVDQSSLAPGSYADFEATVTAEDHRPDFRVASVRWTNEDGTAGNYP